MLINIPQFHFSPLTFLFHFAILEMAQPKTHFIEAVLTCEGNLHDPDFSTKFQVIVDNLKHLLDTSKFLKVSLPLVLLQFNVIILFQ